MIFFEHNQIDSNGTVFEFKALDNEIILGECTLVILPQYAEVTKVSFNEDKKFIVEGLLKAAFNLAANRGSYMARCNISEITFCLDRMNFNKTENGYENDIPTVLMGSCKSCGK